MEKQIKKNGMLRHQDSEGGVWLCKGKHPESGWEGLGCLRRESAKFMDPLAM